MRGRLAITFAALSAAALAGCGTSSQTGDLGANGSGDYPVAVTEASFPAKQHIDSGAVMRITVRNTGTRTLPNLAATVTTGDQGTTSPAFATRDDQPGMADPSRPVWIIDIPPPEGTSALSNTWTLGPLAPGESKTFIWQVHPVVPGPRVIRWRIAPALNGGTATLASGGPAAGSLPVVISDRPPSATVLPNGKVQNDFKSRAGSAATTSTAARDGGGTP